MSEVTSSKLSRSTTNNSKNKKVSITSLQYNFIKNDIDKETPKDEYENFILTKKEKSINLNKIEILKNRINNLKQQEQKNIRQIEILQEKEEKMKKIINAKKENKKKLENFKKKEHDNYMLIKKRIQENRQIEIMNLNNSLMRRRETLNKKVLNLKKDKNEIKKKINTNNNAMLNLNKLKYEKARTNMVFNKDKNTIIKAEKEELKRRSRIEMMNKEKKQNISLEKNIEALEQEEEKYLDLIRQTQLIKQKFNNNSYYNSNNKSFITKSSDNKDLKRMNKKKLLRLQTDESYKKNFFIMKNNLRIRTLHNSIDANSINNYFNINNNNKNQIKNKIYNNEKTDIKNENKNFYDSIFSKTCSNRINNYESINLEQNNKTRENSNDIYQRIKKNGLRQKILDKIASIRLKTNSEK